MRSQNLSYIPQIDHLRFLASMLVFVFHFYHFYIGGWKPHPEHPFLGLVTEGHTGVTLFFVLSGFIFMRISSGNNEIRYSDFLRNRILRIAPLFVVIFIIAASIGRDRFRGTDLIYLFVTNIGDPPTSWHFITGAAWSISIEVSFYLAFPFLAYFTRKYGANYLLRCICLMLLIKVAAYFATANTTLLYYSTLIGRFDQFLIGMLAARALEAGRFFKHPKIILVLSTALIIAAVGVQARYFSYFDSERHHPGWIVWGTIEATIWATLISAYVKAQLNLPRTIETLFRKCGECSFSFYMWHTMVIFLFHESLGAIWGLSAPALFLNLILVLGFSLLVAFLSFATIEKPFLELRHRYVVER